MQGLEFFFCNEVIEFYFHPIAKKIRYLATFIKNKRQEINSTQYTELLWTAFTNY